ncbi:MAG TPA: potassium transporter Kup [Candidatus Limnocylindria bacterium]|nr:potassium transporter Kup [Candidatus Limnocylindria bacterium]
MTELGEKKGRIATLSLAALGVVYGDIGTSPLYTLGECFSEKHHILPTHNNVLGILSLIIWALILIVSIKYIVFVMRADNKGEGGIMALMSIAFPDRRRGNSQARPRSKLAGFLVGAGLFGACLLYGDGMITPAISVLGAVEGIKVATPALNDYVVPISVVILLGLFLVQSAGTGGVGRVFGPIMVTWFTVIALLGIRSILHYPEVLAAVNPWYGVQFFIENGFGGFVILGSVVLAITGGEALYADMGHFGAKPIRIAWFSMVLPALLLNYFGQGALLLHDPSALENPFFLLAPRSPIWQYPLITLATAAAIIASQALISGAFSLTMQAIQLGYVPRMVIEHTSEVERGQIYMPQVNSALMIASIGLVIAFQSSGNLAAAYGIAVTLTMMVTTVLFYFAAQRVWKWAPWQAGLVAVPAFFIEGSFFAANALKIVHGGWFPLVVGAIIFTLMTTWKKGRMLLWQKIRDASLPISTFITSIERRSTTRVEGTAVYMASSSDGTPLALLHNLKHNKVLHQRVIFLTVVTQEDARVPEETRIHVEKLPNNFWRIWAYYGFFEEPNIPEIMAACVQHGLEFKEQETTFFLSRETVIPSRKGNMAVWRERIFAIMSRNSTSATAFFRLPANRVVELGMQVEL